MPKLVGHGARGVADHDLGPMVSRETVVAMGLIRITYSQTRVIPSEYVYASLDTSDRGGPRSFAKRWYRWYAPRVYIITMRDATPNMCRRAGLTVRG